MSKCGTVDNKTTLELSDDAAYKSLKDGWRMPTETEFQNLINNCTWTYGEQDGVKGYFATSNVSGYTSKSIFFPFSGEYCESYMYSQSGIYWTSTLETSYNNNSARAVEIHDPSSPYYYANLKCTIPMRHWGCVIRPVFSDQMPIQFYDYDTKQKCVSLWDTNKDGELSYAEAAAVTSFRGLFYNQTQISYFEEFQYFTGLTDIRYTYKDEDGAFEGCTSLEKIILPENLISIDRYSFDGCTSLKKITIPAKVKYIGESAFYGCSKLFCVTVLAEIPPIFDDDTGDEFGGIKKGAALYVPKGSLESYQKSDWAKFFASISEIIE